MSPSKWARAVMVYIPFRISGLFWASCLLFFKLSAVAGQSSVLCKEGHSFLTISGDKPVWLTVWSFIRRIWVLFLQVAWSFCTASYTSCSSLAPVQTSFPLANMSMNKLRFIHTVNQPWKLLRFIHGFCKLGHYLFQVYLRPKLTWGNNIPES